MARATPGSGISLQIRRILSAPREKVFQAWTDSEILARWFCYARPGYSGRVTELDLRPGGQYRIEIHETSGRVNRLRCEYREIKAPEKLVFTWFWETEPRFGETVVTLEFVDRGNETELILTQEPFPTAEGRDDHDRGWAACFDTLQRLWEL